MVIEIRELEKLLNEEKQMVFTSFDEDTAFKLGQKIIGNAEAYGAVSVQIVRNDQLLFYYSMKGTSIDNQKWCERKSNVVKRFNHSSLYMKLKYQKRNLDFSSYLNLDTDIYQAKGGSVPLLIKGCGNVGSVSVSGLEERNDHKLVVDSIIEFINEEEE